jgi:hypothetical protein
MAQAMHSIVRTTPDLKAYQVSKTTEHVDQSSQNRFLYQDGNSFNNIFSIFVSFFFTRNKYDNSQDG